MNNSDIDFPEIDLYQVKGVLIDLDDTLYRYEPCHNHAIKTCCDVAISRWLTIDAEAFFSCYREQRIRVTETLKHGSCARSRQLAFLWLFESFGIPQAYHHAEEFDQLYWSSFISFMKPASAALKLLSDCKQANIPVCLVSDMQMSVQVKKLEALGMIDLIGFMVTSEETGIEKPAPAMFQAALSKLGLLPSEVIMIGDSHTKDCVGAERIGIKAYQVKEFVL